jgi:hypothetical protein
MILSRRLPRSLAPACLTLALLLIPGAATAQTTPQTPEPAPAPRASTNPISGYMDFHFNKFSDQDGILDFHRFVLLFAHSFTPRIRFVGELELEHAFVEGLEEGGELELEQAYVDFLVTRQFNVRAGMLLMPVGIINERHEPPVFNGVERPLVDTVIVPTTWFETGAGIYGEFGGGWRYRAFVTAPLDALGFSADEGIRGGRQKGSEAQAPSAAVTGRLEFLGVSDLTIGTSFWVGRGHAFGTPVSTGVRLFEADARYQRSRLELRGQVAHIAIPGAADINDTVAFESGVDPNIAQGLLGGYVEAGYRIWNRPSPRDLVTFIRYEYANTQRKMPFGFLPLDEFNRRSTVFGVTYYPDPDVAVKVDYTWLRNRSGFIQSPSSFNVGLGWWF